VIRRHRSGGGTGQGRAGRILLAVALTIAGACADPEPSPVDAPPLVDVPVGDPEAGAVPARYTVAPVRSPGTLVGRIIGGEPVDTSIVPAQDPDICRPFTETLVSSVDGGVGGAVVWLEGVTEGLADDAPRRAPLVLDRCRLEPRLQRVAVGGTVMVNGRDAIFARLRFVAAGRSTPLTTVFLSDVGQVVPVSAATASPGLVRIADERHPWMRAWLVVSPHPYVAITGPDGRFGFDGVPAGRYALVAWHERLGERRLRVRIEAGVRTAVELEY
jgi:hypothetical protein